MAHFYMHISSVSRAAGRRAGCLPGQRDRLAAHGASGRLFERDRGRGVGERRGRAPHACRDEPRHGCAPDTHVADSIQAAGRGTGRPKAGTLGS